VRIADAHGDLLLELAYRAKLERPFAALWEPGLRAGGVRLQVCAVWVPPRHQPASTLRVALGQVAACHRAVAETPGVRLVRTRADLARLAEARDELGLLLALEGCEPLGEDGALLPVFWELGVRVFGLTWARPNAFGSGDGDPRDRGLSAAGAALIEAIAAQGGVLDLAHASPRTFWDALEAVGDAPVLVSHAGARALFDIPRNVADDQLRAIAERGGVVGMMAHPLATGPHDATLAGLVRHVEHACATAGAAHVAIGGDFARQLAASGAFEAAPEEQTLPGGAPIGGALEGFEEPACYPALRDALLASGLTAEAVEGVLGANLLRVLGRHLPA
jgi:membrane dipeptidase